MFTEILTPTQNPVMLELPKELLGHKVRLTVLLAEDDSQPFTNISNEALEFWQNERAPSVGFKFNRDEANER